MESQFIDCQQYGKQRQRADSKLVSSPENEYQKYRERNSQAAVYPLFDTGDDARSLVHPCVDCRDCEIRYQGKS